MRPMSLQAGARKRGPAPGACWALGLLSTVLVLAGCGTTVPPSNARTNARLSPSTGITRDLLRLPKPKARIPVAVYGFRDQTGQFKGAPDSAYSTLVTQGAASILVKALEDSGWYIPVEREGLQNLLTERRIVRAIESPTDKGKPVVNLPNMLPASMIIEGGVIGYESNVRTGGKGANYLGIGASTQYRVDQVTVGLRAVDVRTGQILAAVSTTKTLYSYQFSASVYKFTSFQHLLQGETGYATNEPAQLAVREAIEAAVIHLTASGVRDRYFELQDPGAWDHPVIQAALSEGLLNQGRELPEDDMPVPMRPPSPDREPVVPMNVNGDEATAERPARPRVTAPAPRPAPSAGAAGAAGAAPAAPAPLPAPVPPPVRALSPAPATAATAAPVAAPTPTTAHPAAATKAQTAPAPAGPASAARNAKDDLKGDIFNQYWNRR